MWKEKENGLYDVGPVEIEPTMKTDAAQTDMTPEQELGKEIFCGAWPAVVKYLSYLTGKIKNPVSRWLVKAGLGIIDNLHDDFCKE